MNRNRSDSPCSASGLKEALKATTEHRVEFLAGSAIVVLVAFHATARLSPGESAVLRPAALRPLIVFALLSVNVLWLASGSRRLVRTMRRLDVEPTAECVSLLLRTMFYWALRGAVWGKLVEVLPLLPKDQADLVQRGLWLRLYRHAPKAPLDQRGLAFDTAVLLEDHYAVPYLRRMLRNRDIPGDVRSDWQGKLEMLTS